MEYGKRDVIPGENGYEKTAITLKSIAELVAEEKAHMAALERQRLRESEPAEAAPTKADVAETAPARTAPAPQAPGARLQQPPQFDTASQKIVPARPTVAPAVAEPEPEHLREAVASRSLFSRLWRKKA